MGRWALAAVISVLATVCLVSGGEPRTDAPAQPSVAVGALVKALYTNRGAVRMGMTVANADRACPGAASHVEERVMPLRGSWLDKEGRLNGTVSWYPDLGNDKKVGTIRAVLLAERLDRKEIGRAIVAAGRELGLRMEPEEENRDSWFDPDGEKIDIWVTVGDGVVVIECDALE